MDATLLLVNAEEAVREQSLGKVGKTQPEGARAHYRNRKDSGAGCGT